MDESLPPYLHEPDAQVLLGAALYRIHYGGVVEKDRNEDSVIRSFVAGLSAEDRALLLRVVDLAVNDPALDLSRFVAGHEYSAEEIRPYLARILVKLRHFAKTAGT